MKKQQSNFLKLLKSGGGSVPDGVRKWYAHVLQKLKRYEETIGQYREILGEIDDNEKGRGVFFNIGYCFAKLGKLEDAILFFKKYLKGYTGEKEVTSDGKAILLNTLGNVNLSDGLRAQLESFRTAHE